MTYIGDEDLGDSWTDHDPLEWWAKSSNKYLHLAQLASKYLGIPGYFNHGGNIFNVKRSCLLLDSVNICWFSWLQSYEIDLDFVIKYYMYNCTLYGLISICALKYDSIHICEYSMSSVM